MTDENPFAAPAVADLSTEPRLSFLEQIAVFVTTLVAVVCTFFATCFGSIALGDALDHWSMMGGARSSTLAIVIVMGLMIGLPLLSSAWVLSTVRRAMSNALLEKKKAAMKKDLASFDNTSQT